MKRVFLESIRRDECSLDVQAHALPGLLSMKAAALLTLTAPGCYNQHSLGGIFNLKHHKTIMTACTFAAGTLNQDYLRAMSFLIATHRQSDGAIFQSPWE